MYTRVLSLIVYRLVLVSLALLYQLTAFVLDWPLMPFNWSLSLVLAVSALSVVYYWSLSRRRDRRQKIHNLALVQFILDVAIISVLVALTGGLNSNLNVAYLAIIVLAAIFLEKIAIYAIALLSLSLYYLSLNLTTFLLPFGYGPRGFFDLEPRIAEAMLVQFFLCFVTALISAFIQAAYRSNRKELDERERRIESLRVIRKKIVENLPSGLIICDLKGEIDFVNHMGRRLLQKSNHELVGHNVFDIFNLDPAKGEGRIEGRFISRVERGMVLGGVKKTFGVSFSPVNLESGQHGYMVVYQDLTEIKMLERYKELEDRMSAVGKVAAGVAHEIRNPLAAISGSVHVLREILPEDQTARELAGIVSAETRRLNDFISQFLAYAKPGAPPDFKPLNLADALREFGSLVKNDAYMRDLDLRFTFGPGDPVILGDHAKLNQVFWNLTRNAWQASKKRGEGARVELACRLDDQDVVLQVIDNGVGMNDEQIRDLFTPFQSFSNSGVGLGMSIVYDMIQMHQGTIDVKSEVDVGTCVEIRFHRYHKE